MVLSLDSGRNVGRDAVGQNRISVGTLRLRREDGGRLERRGALGQREDGEPRLRGVERLIGEHREVLCHVMAEGYAEDSDVVGAAVAGANHGLGVELVGDADARPEVRERGLDIAIQADTVLAGDHDFAGGEILKAAVVLAVDVLREVDFPTQSEVDGELGVIFHVSCT